jgi:hypothetical protein
MAWWATNKHGFNGEVVKIPEISRHEQGILMLYAFYFPDSAVGIAIGCGLDSR